MRIIRDLSGSLIFSCHEYPIDSDTAIKLGQLVKLSGGKVVTTAATETGAILGVAAESHPGIAQVLNSRANGVVIQVYDNPTAIFECPAPRITATGGSTTTIISTSGLDAGGTNDVYIGGKAKLVAKAVGSTNTDPIGTVYNISDSVASTQTLTINTAGGAVTAGDVFEIYPPVGFSTANLNTDRDGIVLSDEVALPIKVYNVDEERGKIQLMAGLHILGSKAS